MFSMIRTIGRRSIPLVAALATLATAACGGGDDSPAGPGPTPTEATVTVVNHAANNGSVLTLRYRPCGSSGWSADLLGSGILGSGEQHSWTVSAGCYDVRALAAEIGFGYTYFNGVQVSAGEAKTLEITAFPAE